MGGGIWPTPPPPLGRSKVNPIQAGGGSELSHPYLVLDELTANCKDYSKSSK